MTVKAQNTISLTTVKSVKDIADLAQTAAESARQTAENVDATALGTVTYQYTTGGNIIVVYLDENGYYYIDDQDIRHDLNEDDLDVDEAGELITNREGGLAGQVTSISDEVVDMSVNFSDLQTAHNTLESDTASALDALEQSQADYQTDNDERVNAIQATVSEYLGEAGYINISTDQQDPYLEIGKTIAGDKFYVRLSSTEMGFYQGENRVAYINDNMMHIRKSEVEEEQRLGSFLWTANGNRASLRYSPK